MTSCRDCDPNQSSLNESSPFRIWVDADACPNPVKDILYRTAKRMKICVTMVANELLQVPVSAYIQALEVPKGFDEADEEIVKMIQPGDLVITADIPLAYKTILKKGFAINPRGELYTEDNIGHLLTMRNMMQDLRSTGAQMGGPRPFRPKDKGNFANQLDRFITKYIRKGN